MKNFKRGPKNAILFCSILLSAGLPFSPVIAKSQVSYQPGVLIVPQVFRADGQTEEAYSTSQGLSSRWTPDKSIPLGDKIKLNVFAATGGAELKEIKIRLDNALIADIKGAPWHTTLDTAKLGIGPHMVEVWAVATGNNPKWATQTLGFTVDKVDPAVKVEGMQQTQGPNGQEIENPLPGSGTEAGADTFSDAPPQLPDYLKNQTQDDNATVTVTVRSAASSEQAGGAAITDAPVTVNEPTLFIVQPAPGSTATRYAYALVRNGVTVSTSPQILRTAYDRIRIERRTDTQAGLRPGKITMWIWGIDKQGNYSNPVKTYLDIPADI